jgi:hypothetical protein
MGIVEKIFPPPSRRACWIMATSLSSFGVIKGCGFGLSFWLSAVGSYIIHLSQVEKWQYLHLLIYSYFSRY